MNKTTFMIITESIIKHNKMILDRSQPNKKPGAWDPRLLVICRRHHSLSLIHYKMGYGYKEKLK